jgi:hypothetical protein
MAEFAINDGMEKPPDKYTVRDVPPSTSWRLREEATASGLSLNQTILNTLERGLGLTGQPRAQRDLSFLRGTLTEAAAAKLESVVQGQRQVRAEDWA